MRPGGATVVALEPDERLTVVDSYGGQVAELTVLSPEGADDAGALGARADAPATVLRELVRNGNGFLQQLAAPKLRPDEALAVRLFESMSPPGTSQSFRAERGVKVVVAAPAGRIVDGAPPPSDLLVEIRRGTPRKYGQLELPAPLAEPRLDFRVDKATALAYEVRAGEYIQVIDVEGKQCSDFLAFHRGRLEDGVERGLDATVTRSITGTAYPAPGPLREVLRRRHEPARRGGSRHGRAARHVPARLLREVLRGHGLSRARQLHGQLQRRPRPVRSREAGRLARAQLLLQHGLRRSLPGHGRALVAPRRLRAAAGDGRPRLRLVRVSRRHRSRRTAGRSPTSTCACTRPSTRSRRRSRGA